MSAPARRELVRQMIDKGLSERRSLAVAGQAKASVNRSNPPPKADTRKCALIRIFESGYPVMRSMCSLPDPSGRLSRGPVARSDAVRQSRRRPSAGSARRNQARRLDGNDPGRAPTLFRLGKMKMINRRWQGTYSQHRVPSSASAAQPNRRPVFAAACRARCASSGCPSHGWRPTLLVTVVAA